MKTRLLKILKMLLVAFLIWFTLTGVFVVIDNSFELANRFRWFPVVAVLLPVFLAGAYIVRSLRNGPRKKPTPAERPIKKSLRPTQKSVPSKHTPRLTGLARIDQMEGHEFERFTADLLRKLGYERVQVTQGSGDQGVDVIAVKDGKRYAIQCKRYAQKLGNKPVQEVFAGKAIYGCSVAVVLTNNYFTDGAKEAAKATGVELWDRDTLRRMMDYANYKAIV